jgi:hypothetical protein
MCKAAFLHGRGLVFFIIVEKITTGAAHDEGQAVHNPIAIVT